MPRRRLLLTVSSLVAVALAVTGCTIPTTKDGGGYGPSNQATRKAAKPVPVELHSGAKQKLKSADSSWTSPTPTPPSTTSPSATWRSPRTCRPTRAP